VIPTRGIFNDLAFTDEPSAKTFRQRRGRLACESGKSYRLMINDQLHCFILLVAADDFVATMHREYLAWPVAGRSCERLGNTLIRRNATPVQIEPEQPVT
jgi:hypothetical protein